MAQYEYDGESESCSEDPNAVPQIQSDLKGWCASSVDDFNAAEITREYKFSALPNWTCNVCKRAIRGGSVFQCMQGHLACSPCSSRGASCRVCSNAVSRIKNLEIEKVMDATVATCKYATLGCTEVIEFKDLDDSEHEKRCSFQPFACPMSECHQVGVKNLFCEHLRTKHDIDIGDVVDLKKAVFESSWQSSDFDLDPSTKVVLLREINEDQKHVRQYTFHLLHQKNTEFYDKLYIKPLTKSSKREYELEVKIGNVTYTLKGKYGVQLGLVLLLPKELGGRYKNYHVRSF